MKKGAVVADIGCGHGASTILMAQAYPNSTFYGFDYHAPSIEAAKAAAKKAGVAKRITFQKASARTIRRRNTTWWRCSIACTTWAIRSARRSM